MRMCRAYERPDCRTSSPHQRAARRQIQLRRPRHRRGRATTAVGLGWQGGVMGRQARALYHGEETESRRRKTGRAQMKICAANRVPASYFVSVSYMCWAFRRQGVTLDAEGKIGKWLY